MRKSNLCNNSTSCNIYVQVDFVLEQAMRPRRGSRSTSLLFLKSALGRDGWSTQPPAFLPPGKETPYPLYRRLGGPQGRSGRVRKISLHTGIRSSDRPCRSESLYRLNYPGPPNIDVHKPVSYRFCFILTESALIFFKDQVVNAVHAICVYSDGHLKLEFAL